MNRLYHPLKINVMKGSRLLINCCLSLLLAISTTTVMAQGPYPNTGDHIVCLNSTEPYGVVLTAGSTYQWTITTVGGGNGTITPGATPNLVSINWTSVGTAILKVVETNGTGCVGNPVSINITVNPKPTVTVNSSAICAGTTATVTATPAIPATYTFVWTVPAGVLAPGNVASFTSGIAGTYSVVITSAIGGCSSASASGVVTINAAPTLVINNPSTCGTATVDLTAPAITAGSTAGLAFTYWTDAAATIPYATPTAATTGTYYIKGSLGAGCSDVKPVVVSAAAAPNLVVTNPSGACGALSADITAPAVTAGSTAGLVFTYWTDAAATIPYATPATATPGTYYIKGTTAGGCFAIKPVVVTITAAPTMVVTNPASVCGTSTTDLTAPAVTAGSTAGLTFTYWTDAAATVAYPTPTAATAGTYYIKGTLGAGCFSIKPVVVSATAAPTLVITAPPATCGTVDITAAAVTAGSTAGLTFTYWTDAAATLPYTTPTAATAGTYYIKGTLAGGCAAIKPVTIPTLAPPTPIITGPSPVCESINGSTANYTTSAVAGHTYNWTVTGGTIGTGQGTNTITVTWTAPGTATVGVTETITAGGCTATVSKTITVTAKPVTSPITHN